MSELVYYRDLDKQLLIFPVLGNPVGIELQHISSINLVTELIPIPRSPSYILGIVNIDSNIYPVLDLDKMLSGQTEYDEKNTIISLIKIKETTFGVHTHELPQVVAGEAEEMDPEIEYLPEDWIVGFTEHPSLGKIPVINPEEFWVDMGENEVVGPSLETKLTSKDLYEEDVPANEDIPTSTSQDEELDEEVENSEDEEE